MTNGASDIKDHEGVSNYIHISIEEMDWLVEQAEKVARLEKENKKESISNRL